MIEVTGLSKFYHSRRAIQDVSFRINEGEIVGLLGLNGAGKSTILKILGCFLLPSGGEGFIGGHSLERTPQEVRKLIGYLPDTPPLYNEMPVESYLSFIARLKNVSSAQVKERVADAMKKTNITDFADMALGSLSHGYRQRVGIAQALVHNPRVLILDEPINGLDPLQIVEMRDMILSLKGKHTVILSSHILSEITKTCDRILVIDKGRLVAEGTEAELKHKITGQMNIDVEFVGGGAPLMNKLRALAGVRQVVVQEEGATTRVRLALEEDVRANVASLLVREGAQLYGLAKSDEGLESLFFKLVGSQA